MTDRPVGSVVVIVGTVAGIVVVVASVAVGWGVSSAARALTNIIAPLPSIAVVTSKAAALRFSLVIIGAIQG